MGWGAFPDALADICVFVCVSGALSHVQTAKDISVYSAYSSEKEVNVVTQHGYIFCCYSSSFVSIRWFLRCLRTDSEQSNAHSSPTSMMVRWFCLRVECLRWKATAPPPATIYSTWWTWMRWCYLRVWSSWLSSMVPTLLNPIRIIYMLLFVVSY